MVFEFIQHYLHEHRRSPLIREIQTGCEIASYKSAVDRLNALERKGYLRRAPHKHRGIRLVKKALRAAGREAQPIPQGVEREEAQFEGAIG